MVIKGSFPVSPVSVRVKKNMTAVRARLVRQSPSSTQYQWSRQVHVAQFDDVEERLLFPGVRDGAAVVEAVHRHGFGAEVGAAGEEAEEEQQERQVAADRRPAGGEWSAVISNQ